jgi:hypothetical protein
MDASTRYPVQMAYQTFFMAPFFVLHKHLLVLKDCASINASTTGGVRRLPVAANSYLALEPRRRYFRRDPRSEAIENVATSPPGTRRGWPSGGPQACALTTSQVAGTRPSTRIAS